jgi:hypothetical protein
VRSHLADGRQLLPDILLAVAECEGHSGGCICCALPPCPADQAGRCQTAGVIAIPQDDLRRTHTGEVVWLGGSGPSLRNWVSHLHNLPGYVRILHDTPHHAKMQS